VTPRANPSTADTAVLRRERAATRVTGDLRVVCATGWSTPVHQLSGATRIVWEALEQPQTARELAHSVAVEPNDPFFVQAVDLLVEAQLFTRGEG
jgi:hypothetical protein